MKKILYFVIVFVFIFSSCDDQFLSAPFLPSDDKNFYLTPGSQENVPGNLWASHGEKRSITVSWNPLNNAAFYYIYRASSPLDTFVLCAETSLNQFTFNVLPGSSVYYRVSSVLHDGTESARSNYVIGTSLAQPVISDITDITEDSSAVTWYMDNVSGNTYKDNLLYIVYCFSGDTEVNQIMLDASMISENRAVFSGLNANTRYEYQVEAYLRSNQSNSEKSEKMDAATARRFRPGPPVDLKAARGTAVDKIELTFKLPDMVDIALGDNMFDPKPLYFTVSKRLYSVNGNNEYQLVCAYFGINDIAGGKTFINNMPGNQYMPGERVIWTDNNVVRGLTYEYLVQSYVDNTNRIISSASSIANTTGWALGSGEIFYGKPVYTLNASGEFYESAELPVTFDFDPKGETYGYTVAAKVEIIDDGNDNDPDENFVITSRSLTFEEVNDYKIEMNLASKSSALNPGRGIYSIEIEINLPEDNVSIYKFRALGSVQISEDTQPIVVDNFHVRDGYADRFILVWDNYSNRKYVIEQFINEIDGWTNIASLNNDTYNDDNVTVNENYSYAVTGQMSGINASFRIRAVRPSSDGDKPGQWVYSSTVRTLGIPELSLGAGASYNVITPVWTEAQQADVYRVKYRYTEDGGNAAYTVAANVKREDLSVDATGRSFRFSFTPQGYNDALRAGKEIQIAVDALNERLRAETGGGEISTSSAEDVRTSLVGPALLNLTAGKAFSPHEIDVSWDSVHGAGGYYVFRRQFNMNNTAEEGSESVVYYISASASSSINITGKNLVTDASNSKVDTHDVKAAAFFEQTGSANSRYTLRDMYLTDNEYDGTVYSKHSPAYRDQQNDMIQGWPYRYFVVPVIVRNNVPDPLNMIEFNYNRDGSNKNTSISSYTVRENNVDIQYSGAAALEQEGFTIGFGQNVTATKGTYASAGNSNDGIRITWNPPPRLSSIAGFTPGYTVYRRLPGGSSWGPVTSVDNTVYIDNPQDRGIAYEYAVGISNAGGSSSMPQHSRRFIALCANERDERNRPNMLGFLLDTVRMESVSRSEMLDSQNNFAEEVKWYSTGVNNSYYSGDFVWGIDGYEVFVMNRNIGAGWHTIADVTNISNQINQSIRVSNVQSGDTLQGGLLKVLRDYRHYFKVRSYVLFEGEKIYSPDPDWDYEVLFAQSSNRTNQDRANFLETDYIKWGVRQITPVEFARIANLHIAWGVQWAAGSARSSWTTRWAWIRWSDQGNNNGSGGRVGIETSSGVGKWWFNIQNFRPDMDTNANKNNFNYSVTFLTIDTGSTDSNKIIYADTSASSQFPQWYGRDGNYGSDFADIKGPACVAPLYSGQLRYNSFSWTGGNTEVRYPAGSASVNITNSQANSPLPFQQQEPTGFGTDSRRYTTDAWY